jgi:hypothetical protein
MTDQTKGGDAAKPIDNDGNDEFEELSFEETQKLLFSGDDDAPSDAVVGDNDEDDDPDSPGNGDGDADEDRDEGEVQPDSDASPQDKPTDGDDKGDGGAKTPSDGSDDGKELSRSQKRRMQRQAAKERYQREAEAREREIARLRKQVADMEKNRHNLDNLPEGVDYEQAQAENAAAGVLGRQTQAQAEALAAELQAAAISQTQEDVEAFWADAEESGIERDVLLGAIHEAEKTVSVPKDMMDATLSGDLSAKTLLALTQDISTLAEIASLTPYSRAQRIAEYERKLSAPGPITKSQAPNPITPGRGRAPAGPPNEDELDFASMQSHLGLR